MPMPGNEPYPGTQAVRRALALLKAFAEAEPELGLSHLAKKAGLNRTTAYRLLTALESEGFVVRHGEGDGYRLGPMAIVLGKWALRANDLRSVSRDELAALARQTRETATLEVLRGQQILILDEALGTHLVGATPSVDTLWPVHATSTGKAILAHLPAAERRTALSLPLERFTEQTITSPEMLEEELARIRAQGYATAFEELEQGYAAVSAPIFDMDDRVVAAISVGGPSVRLAPARLRELAPLVQAAAQRISQRLGHEPASQQTRP